MKKSYVEKVEELLRNKNIYLDFYKNEITELTETYKRLNLIDKDINVELSYNVFGRCMIIHYLYKGNKIIVDNIIDIFDFNKHDYNFIGKDGEVYHSSELINPLKTIKDNKLHISGLLTVDDIDHGYETISITNIGDSLELSDTIAEFLYEFVDRYENYDECEEPMLKDDLVCDNVSIEIYATDNKVKLEQAIENKILSSMGELNLLTNYYGWSEFTIEGYSIDKFTIGGHDLHKIFKSYKGKYVHILVEKVEDK